MRHMALNIDVHNAILLASTPLLMVGPFLLAGEAGIGTLAFFLGAILIGIGLAGAGSERTLPLTAQKGLEVTIGIALIGIGLVSAVFDGGAGMTLLLTGFGAALIGLSLVTRYTARIG
jgi:hypothetical protein